MKKINLFGTMALGLASFMLMVTGVNAASATYSFSGTAKAVNGKYEKFIAEDSQTYRDVEYIKLNLHASGGNKLKVSLLHTENWLSTAEAVASSGTLKASNNDYVIYAIPTSKSCPSDADSCLTMPSKYSTDSNGSNIGYDFMTGFRFVNESWFYGALDISGSYTIYYK